MEYRGSVKVLCRLKFFFYKFNKRSLVLYSDSDTASDELIITENNIEDREDLKGKENYLKGCKM